MGHIAQHIFKNNQSDDRRFLLQNLLHPFDQQADLLHMKPHFYKRNIGIFFNQFCLTASGYDNPGAGINSQSRFIYRIFCSNDFFVGNIVTMLLDHFVRCPEYTLVGNQKSCFCHITSSSFLPFSAMIKFIIGIF